MAHVGQQLSMQPWTVRNVIRRMFAASATQPVALLFAVVVLPTLWMIPASMVQATLVPRAPPMFGPGRSLQVILISWALGAWNCVWYAGQLSSAIDVARGSPIRWRQFVTGLAQAPRVVVTALVATLPLELSELLPIPPDGAIPYAASAVACVLTIFLLARTALWAPLIVDARYSLWRSLVASWSATHGSVTKLIVLGVVLTSLSLPVFVLEAVFSSKYFLFFTGTLGALYVLATAQLYAAFVSDPEQGHGDGKLPAETEVRDSGSGWSRAQNGRTPPAT
jgi:hypothetical protein